MYTQVKEISLSETSFFFWWFANIRTSIDSVDEPKLISISITYSTICYMHFIWEVICKVFRLIDPQLPDIDAKTDCQLGILFIIYIIDLSCGSSYCFYFIFISLFLLGIFNLWFRCRCQWLRCVVFIPSPLEWRVKCTTRFLFHPLDPQCPTGYWQSAFYYAFLHTYSAINHSMLWESMCTYSWAICNYVSLSIGCTKSSMLNSEQLEHSTQKNLPQFKASFISQLELQLWFHIQLSCSNDLANSTNWTSQRAKRSYKSITATGRISWYTFGQPVIEYLGI